jgi:XTP/dITP diphosphohydrolase
MDERLIAFERLLNIMDDLREKCPWDKKQTFETLRPLTIEETYELTDAITSNDLSSLKGEIGDLFLHLVFYCKIGSEQNAFDVTSVLNAVCDKLVYRHPHIYSDTIAETEEEVKANWEKLKLKEGKKSVLEGVPSALPALVKASRIQEKVKGIGFEWSNKEDVWAKVLEEIEEFKAEEALQSPEMEEEFGNGAIFDSIFGESKVDKVISKYFEVSKKEILENREKFVQKKKQTDISVKRQMVEVQKLVESVEQKLASQKFLEENSKATIVGKTNKKNLVFENKGKQVKISPEGLLV